MVSAVLLASIAVGCMYAARRLRRAAWPLRGPHAAVVAWQAIGLAWGFAAIGALLAVGLLPYGQGVVGGLLALAGELASPTGLTTVGPFQLAAIGAAAGLTGLLLWMLVASFVAVMRARQRHRELLNLVGRGHPELPGALVLDHPAAAAYCVPGVRSQVVVSAGTLALLDRGELDAVMAHEHAHLRERHDLVLLPFASLRRAFPGVGVVESSYAAVGLLIEMCADDQARRQLAARTLAMALLRIGAAGPGRVPSGALSAAGTEHDVVTRVSRLLEPSAALSRRAQLAILGASAGLMAATFALWNLPL
ncbi:M56 family metallopeptidase [Allonocardiopsis opalescens]|uniref:Peptidase M48-like protein n=1 Tax=Allonocardiopsis opalescens TaxID=1144618 RepID=A0A2T0QAA2_9ACTN|nr:M56 family metallopeptidase [Allonocardiopsis opalescens]PRY00745.1 peptidase M48-like protein [Allonocardiopsis opalescens]